MKTKRNKTKNARQTEARVINAAHSSLREEMRSTEFSWTERAKTLFVQFQFNSPQKPHTHTLTQGAWTFSSTDRVNEKAKRQKTRMRMRMKWKIKAAITQKTQKMNNAKCHNQQRNILHQQKEQPSHRIVFIKNFSFNEHLDDELFIFGISSGLLARKKKNR